MLASRSLQQASYLTKSLDDTQAAGQRPLERFFNLSRSLGGIDTPEMEEVLSEERSYRAEDLTPGEQLVQAMEGDMNTGFTR